MSDFPRDFSAPAPAALSLGQALIHSAILSGDVSPRAAETTARSLLRRGNYPFVFVDLPPGLKQRRVVLVTDIQAALAAWRAAPTAAIHAASPLKRGPGRPRKLVAAPSGSREVGHE